MCKFIRQFKKEIDKVVQPLLIGDQVEECVGKSNSKQLCDKFKLVNIFHQKYLNYEQFKTYQEGTKFIDYGIAHPELKDGMERVTYEPFGYRKGRGNH